MLMSLERTIVEVNFQHNPMENYQRIEFNYVLDVRSFFMLTLLLLSPIVILFEKELQFLTLFVVFL